MYVRPISTRLFSGMLMPEMRAMPYPCRCLCRGFEQMTSAAPWRRMILHFSHIGLTEGRTFIIPFQLGPTTWLWLPFRRPLPVAEEPARARPEGLTAQRAMLAADLGPLGDSLGHPDVPRSEDPRALRRDRHGELEMGRERPVLGVDRPPVVAHAHGVPSG